MTKTYKPNRNLEFQLQETNTKVINLYGGAGTGKSTAAAAIYAELKYQDLETELVQEYAKDIVWEQRWQMFEHPLFVMTEQTERLRRLQGRVDWVITDSPLPLNTIYAIDPSEAYKNIVMETFNEFDNINIFLQRTKPYHQNGRTQTAERAMQFDVEILDMVRSFDPDVLILPADRALPQKISKRLASWTG